MILLNKNRKIINTMQNVVYKYLKLKAYNIKLFMSQINIFISYLFLIVLTFLITYSMKIRLTMMILKLYIIILSQNYTNIIL